MVKKERYKHHAKFWFLIILQKIQNPFEVTLLQYQNTNIKIRLQEKNTEINQLKHELKANESKLLRWDRSVVSIEKAWKQVKETQK